MRTSKKYNGQEIISQYQSGNIAGAIYHSGTQELKVTFTSNAVYSYENVPHETFSAFDNAESQGKYFNTNISKKFTWKKVN